MAVKKAKVTKSTHAAKPHHKKEYNPHESMVIQGGIVFIIISAIAIFSYVMSVYGVLQ